MARRKASVNKSQMIRDAVAANPDKSTAEVSELLKGQGLDVSPQYVSTIKSNALRKAGQSRRGRKRITRESAPVKAEADLGNSVFASAVAFVRAAGSLSEARAALASIEEIGRLAR